MDIRAIDANALIEKLEGINPVDYGAMSSYETHNGAREALSDAVMRVNDAPTLSLNTLRDAIYQDAVEHGLWEEHDNIWWPQECHSLIENEADELYDTIEDWVNGHGNERFTEELADVIIMSMSVAGKLGIDIDAAIRRKMEINKGRPWKHGKSNE